MAEPLPFAEVYRLHSPSVYRFCVSLLRDVTDAEDVTSEVFRAAMVAYERTRPEPEAVLGWLFQIAKNLAANHHRRTARWGRALASLGRNAPENVDVESTIVMREQLTALLDAMAKLRPRDRLLIGLRCAGGLSFAEIGKLTGLSEHAAASATYRAVDRLRIDLEPRQ